MKRPVPFRFWYYFRAGYAGYFSFVMAIFNMFTITYYLMIDNYSQLHAVIPTFTSYIIISSFVIVPLATILGFMHVRRTGAYKADIKVNAESNPYNYRLIPGVQKEVLAPLLLEMLELVKKSNDSKLTDEESKRVKQLDEKLLFLTKGGELDIPKKFDNL